MQTGIQKSCVHTIYLISLIGTMQRAMCSNSFIVVYLNQLVAQTKGYYLLHNLNPLDLKYLACRATWDMPHVILFVNIALATLLSKLLSVSQVLSVYKKARGFFIGLYYMAISIMLSFQSDSRFCLHVMNALKCSLPKE